MTGKPSSIIRELRRRGYRITTQREKIVMALLDSKQHMSAEEVLAQLRQQTQAINLATVYRTLDLLWAEGLIYRNDLSDGKIVFAAAAHGPHIHLVCRKCKQVTDADSQLVTPLGDKLQTEYSFAVDLGHLTLFGLCQVCQTS